MIGFLPSTQIFDFSSISFNQYRFGYEESIANGEFAKAEAQLNLCEEINSIVNSDTHYDFNNNEIDIYEAQARAKLLEKSYDKAAQIAQLGLE